MFLWKFSQFWNPGKKHIIEIKKEQKRENAKTGKKNLSNKN